jgi:hypothetical protein
VVLGHCSLLTHFSAPVSSCSPTGPTVGPCAFPSDISSIFELERFACGMEHCERSIESSTVSNACRPHVGSVCELPCRQPIIVSTKVTRRSQRERMSYMLEFRNSDKERYIRVAAIDIVITQGIWKTYHMQEKVRS